MQKFRNLKIKELMKAPSCRKDVDVISVISRYNTPLILQKSSQSSFGVKANFSKCSAPDLPKLEKPLTPRLYRTLDFYSTKALNIDHNIFINV